MRAIRFSRDFLRRMKWRITLALAIAVVAAVALLAVLDARRQEGGAPGISVMRGEHVAAHIERDELALLDAAQVEFGGSVYSAVSLSALLENTDTLPTIYEQVLLSGADNANVGVSGAQAVESGSVFVLFEKDGAAIAAEDGGPFIALYGDPSAVLMGLDTVTVDLME